MKKITYVTGNWAKIDSAKQKIIWQAKNICYNYLNKWVWVEVKFEPQRVFTYTYIKHGVTTNSDFVLFI